VLNRDASSLADLRRDFQAPAFAVSSDHKQVGRIQAEQLAAILDEAKAVLPGGTWSQLPFLGVDGLPRTGQAFVNRGLLIATVVVPPVAGLALEAVVKAITTQTQPPDLHLIPSCSYPAIESLRRNAVGAR
jgi:hypothetical protein